jgi:hypothetical protein
MPKVAEPGSDGGVSGRSVPLNRKHISRRAAYAPNLKSLFLATNLASGANVKKDVTANDIGRRRSESTWVCRPRTSP